MRSNYKKLGPHIREVNVRNDGNKTDTLLGVSTQKIFIDSIANTIGTDFKSYKVVKRRQFTYVADTSRRGDRIGIALLETHDECLVSPIYTVFEIIDHDDLLPEYLMMWFRRPEFDRYARFKSHGSVREIFGWEEMCDVDLPIPSIEKQRASIEEYHTVVDRIALNERLSQMLEETAQAIYKHWFVDFEFPISTDYAASVGKPELDSKPYKSSGGEMVFNEVLKQEIPKAWNVVFLGDVCETVTKGTTPEKMFSIKKPEYITYIKGESITETHGIDEETVVYIDEATNRSLERSIIRNHDILFSIAGTLGKFALVDERVLPANCNQAVAIIRIDEEKLGHAFVMGCLLSRWQALFFAKNTQQAVQANLSLETICSLPLLMPPAPLLEKITMLSSAIVRSLQGSNIETELLKALAITILEKLASHNA